MNKNNENPYDNAAVLLQEIERGTKLEDAAKRVGVTPAAAKNFIKAAKFMFASNDTSIDDQIYLLQDLEANPLGRPSEVNKENPPAPADEEVWEAVRSRLEVGAHPDELRALALSLNHVASVLDLAFKRQKTQPQIGLPSPLQEVRMRSGQLATVAVSIQKSRMHRDAVLDPECFGEPAWDMMLDLFCQFAQGTVISTTSLCIASRAPSTTALRYIGRLEKAGLVERYASKDDGRVSLIRLSEKGVILMGKVLEKWIAE